MKYYVYLSDSKLEMLHDQLAHSTDEVREASLGFDVKVLKGELKTGRKPSATKYTRLESVLEALQSSDEVGNVWSRKPYIYGQLPMVWASFGFHRFAEDDKKAPITFWGYMDDHIAVGLAGSDYHVLGQTRPDGYAHSHSGTHAITSWLIKHVADTPDSTTEETPPLFRRPFRDDDSNCIYLAVSQIKGTSHRFEFVAKVLNRSRTFDPYESPDRTVNVLLATPIYVAQLD